MSDYVPTEARVCIDFCNAAVKRRQPDGSFMDMEDADAAFSRWLAAHDAEKRADWEAERSRADAVASMSAYDDGHTDGYAEGHAAALAEQGTEKPAPTLVDMRDPECVKAWPECETFGSDPRCCRFPKSCSAGSWVLVDQPASTPDVETRTPNRTEGPELAEVHPDAYLDYATDRPNGGQDA